MELYSTALSLWFGEYVYEWYDEEEYEDKVKVKAVAPMRTNKPTRYIRTISNRDKTVTLWYEK